MIGLRHDLEQLAQIERYLNYDARSPKLPTRLMADRARKLQPIVRHSPTAFETLLSVIAPHLE